MHFFLLFQNWIYYQTQKNQKNYSKSFVCDHRFTSAARSRDRVNQWPQNGTSATRCCFKLCLCCKKRTGLSLLPSGRQKRIPIWNCSRCSSFLGFLIARNVTGNSGQSWVLWFFPSDFPGASTLLVWLVFSGVSVRERSSAVVDSRMSKVDDILGYQRNDAEDFYKILGCDESSSVSFFLVFGKSTKILQEIENFLQLVCNKVAMFRYITFFIYLCFDDNSAIEK